MNWSLPSGHYKKGLGQILNLGIKIDPQMVKINANLDSQTTQSVEELPKVYKDVFAWTYKD